MGAPDEFHPDAHEDAKEITGDRNYGEWGQCVATAKSTGDRCRGYAQGEHGKCSTHGGATPTKEENENVGNGDQTANQNARTHGLHSTPEYLKEHLEPHHEDTYIAMFEALCTRYEEVHGRDPDYFARKRLSRMCIETVKEDLVDEWLAENAEESGNLLIDHIEFEGDDGETVEMDKPHEILEGMTALKRETRLTMKDMGLLRDPDTKRAEATGTLAASIKKVASSQQSDTL